MRVNSGVTVNGFRQYALFDPITHWYARIIAIYGINVPLTLLVCSSSYQLPSGTKMLGNRGKDGVSAFLKQHQCGSLCKTLGLATMTPETPNEERLPELVSVINESQTQEDCEARFQSWSDSKEWDAGVDGEALW